MIDLRLVRQEDAAAYLDFFRAVSAETDNLAASAEDAAKISVDGEALFIKSMIQSGSFSVVAFDGPLIVGSCDIRIPSRPRVRHRAPVAQLNGNDFN